MRRAERLLGFALRLEFLPGLPLVACRRLERRIEDYAEAQDLNFEGTQLRHVLSAQDREVSVADQVALIGRRQLSWPLDDNYLGRWKAG